MTPKNTLILVCVAITAIGMVVLVALGTYTVLEGLSLFAMASVFLGLCAITDADDWSGSDGEGDGGDGWFGGGDGGDAG